MRRGIAAVAAAGVLVLAGCGGGASAGKGAASSTHSASPSVTRAKAQQYGTVVELKNAAVAAGYECKNWTESNLVTAAAESGTCSDEDVFMTFTSTGDRDEIVSTLRGVKGGTRFLVGPNWILNGPKAPAMQSKLGGTVVRPK